MPKLLTFFAEKPQGNFVDESDAVDRVALQAIRDAVQPTAGASHVFEPVRSLVEISDYLTAYPVDPGDHVQIIGHGRSGALELAYMWTHKYADAVDTYVVDSDPFSYKMLTAIIHPQATISIVGCLVGLGGSGSSDGPTLVYDLARLWLCAVSAPVGYIDPSDFVDGRLGDNVPQVRATPTSISIPNSTPSPPTVTDGIATLAITGLLRAPVLGDRDDGARRERLLSQFAGNLLVRRITPTAATSAGELVLQLDNGATATLLANASIIRVRFGDTVEHFTPVDVGGLRSKLRRSLTSLRR
jgi:hypothetical protein